MRRGRVFALFAVCAVALLGVTAWLTVTVRRLEDAQAQSQAQAAFEESVRLALWRMESLLLPLLARENARPHYVYEAFYPAKFATVTREPGAGEAELWVESPLASDTSPHVRLHFQWSDAGGLASPRLPPERWRRREDVHRRQYRETAARLETLGRVFETRDRKLLLATAPLPPPPRVETRPAPAAAPARAMPTPPPDITLAARIDTPPPPQQERALPQSQAANMAEQQAYLNRAEASARSQQIAQISSNTFRVSPDVPKAKTAFARAAAGVREIQVEPLAAVWLGEDLVLVRSVRTGTADLLQGCWLDWPGLRQELLGAVADLLPQAKLEPARAGPGGDDEERVLATIPIRLVPGRSAVLPPLSSSGLQLPLIVSWAFALLALTASGVLLWGMASLDERRSAFVSAVTHELRTPLTTFRMYSDMLAEGMVRDETQRREYLETLQREAERQSHLVENVLAYSRLERARAPAAPVTTTVEALLNDLVPPLAAHAERCGMTLVVAPNSECHSTRVAVDRAAVERVLFNLVDNACKYARRAEDRRIHLDCAVDGVVSIHVSDHGPGVDARSARRLFRAFHKSARDAALAATPGVGLGLALSRRLARAMGGDLRLAPGGATSGARFCLELPRA